MPTTSSVKTEARAGKKMPRTPPIFSQIVVSSKISTRNRLGNVVRFLTLDCLRCLGRPPAHNYNRFPLRGISLLAAYRIFFGSFQHAQNICCTLFLSNFIHSFPLR